MIGFDLHPEWRKVLSARSVKDKFAIARSCDLAPTWALPAISEMVREGIVEFVEPAWLHGIYCDVYQITAKGIVLCEMNGIRQQ